MNALIRVRSGGLVGVAVGEGRVGATIIRREQDGVVDVKEIDS